MFSRDLLVTRKRKPYITPVYIHPEEPELAAQIIDIYKEGKTKTEIDEQTALLETHRTFRVVRGLSELMRRRTTFEADYAVEPKAVREYLYGKGYVTTTKQRHVVVTEAAQHFDVSAKDIEASFWADREEYQKVTSVAAVSPSELVKYYNLSLTQTLLFDALSLEFTTSGNYQEIFRIIKYLGLMYELNANETVTVEVTGPASLFRKTKKYGTSLAKLLPKILKAPSWKLKARVETTVAGEPRIYIFELSDTKQEFFPDIPTATESFDSAVEENFLKRFQAVRKDWTITREPTVLKAGPSAMIPDFSLERRGKKCYIEIVGFWTPEYLKKKTEKVKTLQKEIILCVNKELQCTKKDFQKKGVDIIFYDKTVPLKPILERVRKIESEQLAEEKEKLSETKIVLEEDITSLEDIAEKYSVGIESVKRILEEDETGAVIGNKFIKNSILEEIQQKIESLENMQLETVKRILDQYNLDEIVLERIGYRVEWKTLDVESALVKKIR